MTGALIRLHRYEEALASSEEAIQLDPQLAGAWNNKGAVLEEMGLFTEALNAYEKAVELDSTLRPAHGLIWHGYMRTSSKRATH